MRLDCQLCVQHPAVPGLFSQLFSDESTPIGSVKVRPLKGEKRDLRDCKRGKNGRGCMPAACPMNEPKGYVWE